VMGWDGGLLDGFAGWVSGCTNNVTFSSFFFLLLVCLRSVRSSGFLRRLEFVVPFPFGAESGLALCCASAVCSNC
jgi:hypothetical protein